MARLFLIDQSLKRPGGHHFDYSLQVAKVATHQNIETLIGTHRSFKDQDLFPANCEIRNVFRNSTYSKDSKMLGVANLKAAKMPKGFFAGARRWRRSKAFATDLATFFSDCRFRENEHVFCTTLSDIDLEGIKSYFEAHPETVELNWHLQFHFNIFEGGRTDYQAQQDSVSELKRQFDAFAHKFQNHNVRFYCTSEELTRQYNSLGSVQFESLVYPINPELNQPTQTSTEKPSPSKLLTIAGGLRKEKGEDLISSVIRSIWDPLIESNFVQVGIQRKAKRIGKPAFEVELIDRNSIPEIDLADRNNMVISSAARPKNSAERTPRRDESKIKYFDHPLSAKSYVDLIRKTDIGLLLYDRPTYFSRRAGVLGEYLAAGKPVIVPAGTWLSSQIAECNAEFSEQIRDAAIEKGECETATPFWHRGFDPHSNSLTLIAGTKQEFAPAFHHCVPENTNRIALEFEWTGRPKGKHIAFLCVQVDCYGNIVDQDQKIVEAREKGRNSLLFSIHPNSKEVIVQASLAFEETPTAEENLTDFLIHSLTGRSNGFLPSAVVGRSYSDPEEIAKILAEMLVNYDHYKVSSQEFSYQWFARHDPQRTVEQILGKNQQAKRAA